MPREGGYRDRHPGPSDIKMLAEVADSTLRDDKRRKIPRYAGAGIPEVWLVDFPQQKDPVSHPVQMIRYDHGCHCCCQPPPM